MRSVDIQALDVYLFDVDSQAARITKQAFELAGVGSPKVVSNEEGLVEILQQAPCDFLAIDQDVSQENSSRFIRDLRSRGEQINEHMRIVAITSQPTRDLVNEVIHAGADGVLVKTLVPAKVRYLIDQLTVNGPDYVVTPDYVGPNRRRLPDVAEFTGEERREDEPD